MTAPSFAGDLGGGAHRDRLPAGTEEPHRTDPGRGAAGYGPADPGRRSAGHSQPAALPALRGASGTGRCRHPGSTGRLLACHRRRSPVDRIKNPRYTESKGYKKTDRPEPVRLLLFLGHDADFRPKTDGARRGRKYTDSTGQRSRLVPAFPCRLPGTVRWRVRLPVGSGGTELYRVGQNALATGAAQVSFLFSQPPARHMTYGRDLSGPAVWAEQCVPQPGAGSVR